MWLRVREHPTVSMPVTWREVERCRKPAGFTFTAPDVPARLGKYGDPLSDLHEKTRPCRPGFVGSRTDSRHAAADLPWAHALTDQGNGRRRAVHRIAAGRRR